jgi:methionine aminopeptidase
MRAISDPETFEPEIFLSSINDISALIGTQLSLSTEVSCFVADCGDTSIYLQYDDGGQWITLSQDTPIRTQQNTKQKLLLAGSSEEVEWNVDSVQSGGFSLRAVADSQHAGMDSKEFTVSISQPDVILIQVETPDDFQIFSRGDELYLKILVSKNGVPKEDLSPIVTIPDLTAYTYLLSSIGSGYYESSIHVPDTAKGQYPVIFQAEGVQESVMIEVDSSLDIEISTEKSNYQTDEVIKVTGAVRKRGVPVDADIDMAFTCEENSITDSVVSSSGIIDYLFAQTSLLKGACSIQATASYKGNRGSDSKGFTVTKSVNDRYQVAITNPDNGDIFRPGDEVNISVSVTMDSNPVENVGVVCTNPFGIPNIRLDNLGSGSFSGSVHPIRNQDTTGWTLGCEARSDDGLFGSGFVNVEIVPLLFLDLIYPNQNYQKIELGQEVEILIETRYSDFGILDDGAVSIQFGNETKQLEYTGNGKYSTTYTVSEEGLYNILIVAEDDLGNSIDEIVSLDSRQEKETNWVAFGLVVAGIALLFMILIVYRIRKGKTVVKTVYKTVVKGPDRKAVLKGRVRDLEKERTAIEKAMEEAEMEYYHRKITEKEFRKMMNNFEQQLLKTDAQLKGYKRELEGLR